MGGVFFPRLQAAVPYACVLAALWEPERRGVEMGERQSKQANQQFPFLPISLRLSERAGGGGGRGCPRARVCVCVCVALCVCERETLRERQTESEGVCV